MNKTNDEHLKIEVPYMVCKNCGEKSKLDMPMELREVTQKMNGFVLLHKNCKPKKDKG